MNFFKAYIIFLSFLFPSLLYAQYVSDFRVNDDTGSAYQSFAKIDVDQVGNFIVVWEDQRNGNKIYFQRYNLYGTPLGSNTMMDISPDISARSPRVQYRNDGTFIILWYGADGINPASFKFRFFNQLGIPITTTKVINDTVPIFADIQPAALGIDHLNNFYVVMSYTPGISGGKKLYIQKFDSSGKKIGNNQLVADSGISSAQETPAMNKDIYNRFMVSWNDTRSGVPDIFMQLYDSTGQKIGTNKKVPDDNIPNSPRTRPSLSSDSSGRFIISWTDSRLTLGDYDNIFTQLYDSEGNEIGNNFRVDLGPANAWNRRSPRVATRTDGNTVIAWSDQIGGPTMRKLSPEGLFIGGEYFISYQGVGNSKILNDIAIWEDRIITVWQDNRNSDYDIYCNIRSYQNPDSVISNITTITNEIPEDFKLYQNYPNPFNSSTKIRFEIPVGVNMETADVKLRVYNSLGQEVTLLINEPLFPGMYEYFWDAREIPSGVYFYRITAGEFSETRKLILLR